MCFLLQVVKGSSKLFKALLDRCLAREVVAICRYIPRQNAQPFFVALVPQAEKLDDNNMQIEAPGFHVIFLPFAEDFRALHIEESPKGLHIFNEGVVQKLMQHKSKLRAYASKPHLSSCKRCLNWLLQQQ